MNSDDFDENISKHLDYAEENAHDMGMGSDDPDRATKDDSDDEASGTKTARNEAASDDDDDQTSEGKLTERQSSEGDDTNSKRDAKGNLIDPKTQEPVAQRGAERRLFEKANGLQRSLEHERSEHGKLRGWVDSVRPILDHVSKLGVDTTAAIHGITLMNNLRNDPINTVREILQVAVSQGHDLSTIIGHMPEGANANSIDVAGIKRMIDEKLAPITNEREQSRNQQIEQTRQREAAQEFVSSHEYSELHMPMIVKLIQDNPGTSADRAYNEVYRYAITNNLDFSKPLDVQVRARQQGNNRDELPMPNGNSTRQAQTRTTERSIFGDDDDFASITREAMRESGMQI